MSMYCTFFIPTGYCNKLWIINNEIWIWKYCLLTSTDVALVMVPVATTADILIFLDAYQEHVYAIIEVCFAKWILGNITITFLSVKKGLICLQYQWPRTIAQPAVVYFFWGTFTSSSSRNFGLFWPIWAILLRLLALLGVLYTDLKNVAAYQNWQIWGMIRNSLP